MPLFGKESIWMYSKKVIEEEIRSMGACYKQVQDRFC